VAEDLSTAPKIGELFAEKYRIDRVLGRGGMGFVLAATHIHLDEQVAIKMLLPRLATHPDTVARFLREGRAAVKIRSKHVARVIDVGTFAGSHYIVMEYLGGEDLADVLIREKRLPFARAVDFVLQACEAIAEAHAIHIVHRDLKPANLFLARVPGDDEPYIKVLDFGISKMPVTDNMPLSLTSTSTLMGSPLYMSPEQLRSAKAVDSRADIWSMGIILFELISGRPPFVADSLPELGALIFGGRVPDIHAMVADVPQGLTDAILKCLRVAPAERYASVADLANDLSVFGSPAAIESAKRVSRALGHGASQRSAAAYTIGPSETSKKVPTVNSWGSATSGDNPSTANKRTPRLAVYGGIAACLVAGGVFAASYGISAKKAVPVNDVVLSANASANVPSPSLPSTDAESRRPIAEGSARPVEATVATTVSSVIITRAGHHQNRPEPIASVSTIATVSAAPPTVPSAHANTPTSGFSNDRHE